MSRLRALIFLGRCRTYGQRSTLTFPLEALALPLLDGSRICFLFEVNGLRDDFGL